MWLSFCFPSKLGYVRPVIVIHICIVEIKPKLIYALLILKKVKYQKCYRVPPSIENHWFFCCRHIFCVVAYCWVGSFFIEGTIASHVPKYHTSFLPFKDEKLIKKKNLPTVYLFLFHTHCKKSYFFQPAVSKCSIIYHWHLCDGSQRKCILN